eukprot:GFUD01027141.1.p1 GENE.GFUD01027141.1~~GFUD01027141.1.p1  ORF type:complete len:198 (+),score=44.94 GFUD01027141.1:43-636(+)
MKEEISVAKPHITWGGENIHHLANVPEMEDEDRFHIYEKTSRNSKLHRLAKAGDCESVKRYFESKDPEEIWNLVQNRNSQGSTPLHVASYFGRKEMINLLIDNGAKPFLKNKEGWHAGHYACRWSQPLDLRLSVGLKPCSPAMNSFTFSFKRIRDMRKCAEDTPEMRKQRLKSDSGISVCGSRESLGRISGSRDSLD